MKYVKKLVPLGSAVIFLIGIIFFLKTLFLGSYPDFRLNYHGAKAVLSEQNPYLGGPEFFTPFNYPPAVLLIYIPLTILSIAFAQRAWTAISIISLLLSIFFLFRMLKISPASTKGLLLTGLTFSLFPVKFTLGMGQINHVVLLLAVLTLYFFIKKKDALAGLSLGLSLSIKLFPPLLMLLFLIKRKWKLLASMAATLVVVELLTLLIVPGEYHLYFLQRVLPDFLTTWKGDYYNQSLSGVLMRLIGSYEGRTTLRLVLTFLGVVIVSTVAWQKRKVRKSDVLLFALFLVTNVLLNTFSWQHHFVFLIPAFLIAYIYMKGKPISLVLLAASYLLVSGNLKNPLGVQVIFASHVFVGGLILWVTLIHLLQNSSE